MIIITAVGDDRPGMAHALTRILFETGCNIEDTTMTRLAGEFAMILIVSPPDEFSLEQLKTQLAPLEKSHGLFVNCREIGDEEPEQTEKSPRFIVSAYGAEHAGLLAKLTGVFAQNAVNITDVQTRVASAGTVYVMIFEIELPSDLAPEFLARELEKTGQEIGMTINLRPLEEETL